MKEQTVEVWTPKTAVLIRSSYTLPSHISASRVTDFVGNTSHDMHLVSAKQTHLWPVCSMILVSQTISLEVLLLRAAVAWSKFT